MRICDVQPVLAETWRDWRTRAVDQPSLVDVWSRGTKIYPRIIPFTMLLRVPNAAWQQENDVFNASLRILNQAGENEKRLMILALKPILIPPFTKLAWVFACKVELDASVPYRQLAGALIRGLNEHNIQISRDNPISFA